MRAPRYIGAGQATSAQRDTVGRSGAADRVMVERQGREGDRASYRGHEGGDQGGGGGLGGPPARSDQDGCQDRAPPIP